MPDRKSGRELQDKDPKKQIMVEALADQIKGISEAMAKLRSGPINDRALILLIQDACPEKVSQATIRQVMDATELLSSTYLKSGRKP